MLRMWSRELCDCVEAILVPSGDRIKDLVEDIFEVLYNIHVLWSSCHILYTHMCKLLCIWSLIMYMIIDYVCDHWLCVWSLTCWSQQVVEVSHDSPSWHSFLDHIDQLILNGLRSTILCALKTLTDRVAQYEQVSHSIWYMYVHMCCEYLYLSIY